MLPLKAALRVSTRTSTSICASKASNNVTGYLPALNGAPTLARSAALKKNLTKLEKRFYASSVFVKPPRRTDFKVVRMIFVTL